MTTKKSPKDVGVPARLLMRWADHHNPQKNGPTALHTAAFKGELKKVKKLLEAGTDVNAVDVKGWTPLHDAVIQGHTEIVKLFIDLACTTILFTFLSRRIFFLKHLQQKIRIMSN